MDSSLDTRGSRETVMRCMRRLAIGLLCVAGAMASHRTAAGDKGDLAELLGTWRGTSTCVNLKVAPACKDETVVYEVRSSEKPATAILKADKIVDDQRVPMGELEFVYDAKEACWRSEFRTARVHAVWCLTVVGRTMTGHLRDIPSNADVREVQLKRE